MYTKIKTQAQLDKMLAKGNSDFFIALAGGLVRSSKNIYAATEKKTGERVYEVINNIDDSSQIIPKSKLLTFKGSNIGKAIKAGAFYAY